MPGQAVADIWTDIPPINSQARERLGYPTQKPIALLNRIIKASSNEGDVVLDPFCGCATTLVAADGLSRQWIGIDISEKAAELVVERVLQSQGLWRKIVHRTDLHNVQTSETFRDTTALKTAASSMVSRRGTVRVAGPTSSYATSKWIT